MELLFIERDHLVPDPENVRTVYDETELKTLALSIGNSGLHTPLEVRPNGEAGHYLITSGHRRLRAIEYLAENFEPTTLVDPSILTTIPCILKERTNEAGDVTVAQLIENLQRADLDPFDEAAAFVRLTREFKLKQRDLAGMVGCSQAHISKRMALLTLDDDTKALVRKGSLTLENAVELSKLDERGREIVAAHSGGSAPTAHQIEQAAATSKLNAKRDALVTALTHVFVAAETEEAAKQGVGIFVIPTNSYDSKTDDKVWVQERVIKDPAELEGAMPEHGKRVVVLTEAWREDKGVYARVYKPVPVEYHEAMDAWRGAKKEIEDANQDAQRKHAAKVQATLVEFTGGITKAKALDYLASYWVADLLGSYLNIDVAKRICTLAALEVKQTLLSEAHTNDKGREIKAKYKAEPQETVKEALANPKLRHRTIVAAMLARAEWQVTSEYREPDEDSLIADARQALKNARVPLSVKSKVAPAMPQQRDFAGTEPNLEGDPELEDDEDEEYDDESDLSELDDDEGDPTDDDARYEGTEPVEFDG